VRQRQAEVARRSDDAGGWTRLTNHQHIEGLHGRCLSRISVQSCFFNSMDQLRENWQHDCDTTRGRTGHNLYCASLHRRGTAAGNKKVVGKLRRLGVRDTHTHTHLSSVAVRLFESSQDAPLVGWDGRGGCSSSDGRIEGQRGAEAATAASQGPSRAAACQLPLDDRGVTRPLELGPGWHWSGPLTRLSSWPPQAIPGRRRGPNQELDLGMGQLGLLTKRSL